jgi:hypothetical protein
MGGIDWRCGALNTIADGAVAVHSCGAVGEWVQLGYRFRWYS